MARNFLQLDWDKDMVMTCVLLVCRYPYLAVVLNFSQSWALYCLVQFYSVTKDKLAPIKPLAKFLTFKSIVFLTWWQGVGVAFLFSIGALKGSLAQELKTRIQDYIICIEVCFGLYLVHYFLLCMSLKHNVNFYIHVHLSMPSFLRVRPFL